MKYFVMAAVAAASLLTACGGGGGNSGETKVRISSVKVVGASLADSGTFGHKFTVRSDVGVTYQVYPERIASNYGLAALCSAYTATSSSTFTAANTSCTNYAVAGAAVNYVVNGTSVDSIPVSLVKQLTDLGNAGFASGDLLIVGEGSANDTANLVLAYQASVQAGDTASATGTYRTFLKSLITSPTTLAALTDVQAGGLYMQLLADKLTAAVKANALDKGATRIAILNTLDVTKTPKFQAALAGLGSNAAAFQALVQGWTQAYNARLNADVAAYAGKVVVVDFYTNFNAEMADPAQYGLTNTSATVCDQVYAQATSYTPTVGTAGTTSLATTAVVGACTDSAASSITPTVGAGSSNWWKTYLYADNFHPTPYGHQLLGQLVAKRLTEAGWL